MPGTDGDYVIDITARFSALGASFLVLVECKHCGRQVERQDVQVLHSKLLSVDAQKAVLFATSGFQSGAIEFANAHGIALVQFASGKSTWFTKSAGPVKEPPSWANIPKYVGWWHHGNSRSVVSKDHSEYTRQFWGCREEVLVVGSFRARTAVGIVILYIRHCAIRMIEAHDRPKISETPRPFSSKPCDSIGISITTLRDW